MIPELTDRQRAILDFLKQRANSGLMPTVREIGTHFGITSPNGVLCHIKALEKKGLIKRSSGAISRGIVLTQIDELQRKRSRVLDVAELVCSGAASVDDLRQAFVEYRT
jgi:repressor LexA